MLKLTLYITTFFIVLNFTSVHSIIENYDNPDCVVNTDLEPEETGNYIDCNTPEALADNKTRCCDIEGAKGCCSDEPKSKVMITIGTTMSLVTIAVMTACFVVFWCHPDTCPCLKRCPCKCCHRGSNEFTEEMTDLSDDIKKAGLANQAYMRENVNNDVYAPPEKYDMPEELKEKVQDDWWGGEAAATSAF